MVSVENKCENQMGNEGSNDCGFGCLYMYITMVLFHSTTCGDVGGIFLLGMDGEEGKAFTAEGQMDTT